MIALTMEKNRIKKGWEHVWHYSSLSLYSDKIDIYINKFGRENVWVGLFEDMQNNPSWFFQKIADFIGVQHMSAPPTRINESASIGTKSHPVISRTLDFAKKLKITGPTGKASFFLERLAREMVYRDEIIYLKKLFNEDVSRLSNSFPELDIDRKWKW